jgi:hypothetical protein
VSLVETDEVATGVGYGKYKRENVGECLLLQKIYVIGKEPKKESFGEETVENERDR